MAHGIEIRDAAGNLTVDFSSRLGRVLGILTSVAEDGSHVDSRFAEGTPWAAAITSSARSGVFLPFTLEFERGEITFAGTTMNWADLPAGVRRIIYGVY